MADVTMQVQPASGGWRVDCDLPLERTYFRSGARAEKVACDLAIRLSGAGHDVQVIISDRTSQIIATRRYFAA
jgi:hypothetical protein